MDGRSLLLIGGTGFFGKSFLDAHRRGLLAPWSVDRIFVVARRASALSRDHPDLLGPNIALVDADAGNAESLPPADYVLHFASSTDARRYAEDPQAERANILASIDNYIRLAKRDHAKSRIVYASSGAVYGQQPPDLPGLPEDYMPGDVGELVSYKRDYAEAKRIAEQRIANLGDVGIRTAVARCFAFLGFYLPRDQHFAIGNFLADGLAGRSVRINARKAVYRSYMHADDLVRWLMTIADASSVNCPIYNVGSDEALIMGDVAQVVAARFGVAADVPPITEDTVDRYNPSLAKARAELGLDLSYDLRSAVDEVARRLQAKPPPSPC